MNLHVIVGEEWMVIISAMILLNTGAMVIIGSSILGAIHEQTEWLKQQDDEEDNIKIDP